MLLVNDRQRRPRHTIWRWVVAVWLLQGMGTATSWGQVQPDPLPIAKLRTATVVGQDVQVQGIVTYFDPTFRYFFVQDASDAAIFVTSGNTALLEPGTRVAVFGRLVDGHLAPIVEQTHCTVGSKQELPAAIDVELEKLQPGEFDCRWVRVKGKVLQAAVEHSLVKLSCRSGVCEYEIQLPAPGDLDMESIVGAHFEAEGVLASQIHENRFVGFRVLCQTDHQIRVIEPGPKRTLSESHDVFEQVLRLENPQERFRLKGQVTFVSDTFFTMETNQIGLRIDTRTAISARPGDLVEVEGARTIEAERVRLTADVVRAIQSLPFPTPGSWTIREVLDQRPDARRIQIQAKLSKVIHATNQLTLVLQAEGHKFKAHLPIAVSRVDYDDANQLTLRGVCDFHHARDDADSPFVLWVADSSDIEVDSKRLALTLPAVLIPIGSLIAVLTAVLLWNHSLQRQVNRHTRRLNLTMAQLRSSFESMSEGIIVFDNLGQVIATNRMAGELFDRILTVGTRDTVAQQAMAAVLSDPEEWLECWQAIQDDPDLCLEFNASTSHRNPRNLRIATTPVVDQAGHRHGRLWVLRDTTDLHHLQQQLTQSQKMEAVGRLVGGLAHDLNNLLTGITSSLAVARLESQAESSIDRHLETAETAAFRAADILQQLQGMSRSSPLQMRVCRVNDVISGTVRLLTPILPSRIELRLQLDPSNPTVRVDDMHLEQVLLNLAINARDAMSSEGILTLKTVADEFTRPGSNQAQPMVRISVEDNGCGMSDEIKAHVFDPFFTTKPQGQGSGLGLATSYGLIQQHGGWMEFNSKLGRGTEFFAFLPVQPNEPDTKAASQEDKPARESIEPRPWRVLIVDDEDMVRESAARLLEHCGFQTTAVSSGSKALEFLARDPDATDLVLLDTAMPEMTGEEVLAEITKRYPRLPVVICSGYVVNADRFVRVPDAIVKKPFRIEQLRAELERVLDDCPTHLGIEPHASQATSADPH